MIAFRNKSLDDKIRQTSGRAKVLATYLRSPLSGLPLKPTTAKMLHHINKIHPA
jgi:hypothetical protein